MSDYPGDEHWAMSQPYRGTADRPPPAVGERITLRCPLGTGEQHVTGAVLALFTDERERDGIVTRVPCVRIRAEEPGLGGSEDVWEAPLTDVVRRWGRP